MTDVRDGILHELRAGNEVTVYARTEDLVVVHEGLNLNIIEGFEQALIQRYVPACYNFVDRAA